MNICLVIGKIVSKIEFNFIINKKSISKNISISRFKLEIEENENKKEEDKKGKNKKGKNKTEKIIIEVIGYKEKADYCYSKLVKGDIVSIYGKLNSSGKIEIEEIDLL